MSRNPFITTPEQWTEFSFGRGRFPNPVIDFQSPRIGSAIVARVADPDRNQQLLDLAAMKRQNLQDVREAELPAFQGSGGIDHMTYHQFGNTERYGAGPPLVRERTWPPYRRVFRWSFSVMQREW